MINNMHDPIINIEPYHKNFICSYQVKTIQANLLVFGYIRENFEQRDDSIFSQDLQLLLIKYIMIEGNVNKSFFFEIGCEDVDISYYHITISLYRMMTVKTGRKNGSPLNYLKKSKTKCTRDCKII